MTENAKPDRTRNASFKFSWLERVASDRELSRLDLHVALALCGWIDFETFQVWRSQKDLASDVRVTLTGVRNCIDRLIQRGHLAKVTEGNGRGHAATYRVLIKAPETDNGGCTFKMEKEQHPLHVSENKGATAVEERCNGGANKGATAVAPTPYSQSVKESVEKNISRRTTKSNDDEAEKSFDEFWRHYPKKVSKGSARKAYATALKTASAGAILSGARRYADAREGEDHQFTKHPATWLHQECWTDEPPPKPKSTIASIFEMMGETPPQEEPTLDLGPEEFGYER